MKQNLWSATLVALGIALAGLFIYLGFRTVAYHDRSVTVKGLSTRTVECDYVVWPLRFTVTGNDLPSLYASSQQIANTLRQFMLSKGLEENDLQEGSNSVTDQWASWYEHRPAERYSLTASVIVSTNKVKLVSSLKNAPNELLAKGIMIDNNDWSCTYYFNGLSELKPSMIEEATHNARAVAQKFADDSDSRLGGIRHASQGQFTVDDDEHQHWIKHVRVVTTIDYYLE